EINQFATGMGLPSSDLKEYIEEYEYSNIIDQTKISDSLQVSLLVKSQMAHNIISFIQENTERYSV
ncbi:hypothetical protein J4G37_43800, partial [Microvirga sp. 3-52]|nr:hypothetical protein [Microvirga sp. 3-52]